LFQVNGSAGAFVGGAVAGVGDVNSDTVPDLIVGATANSVKVLSGSNGATLKTLTGGVLGDLFSAAVGSPGDFDGDGDTDYVVGAPWSDEVTPDSGAVYVFSGATSGVLQKYLGSGVADHLGIGVAGLGDLNADGRGDFVTGAPGYDGAFNDLGRARVFVGLPETCLNLTTSVDLNVDGVPDACQHCQNNLAAGGPGNMHLQICGDPLTFTGSIATLGISKGTPLGQVFLLASTSNTNSQPFFGGTIWTLPVLAILPGTFDVEGNWRLQIPGGISGPVNVYLQAIAPWPSGPNPYEISGPTLLQLGY
jgi:FG-GAP repeat